MSRQLSISPPGRPGVGSALAQLRDAKRLPREFFNRDAITVARELLGKLLIRREGRMLLAGRVVEDEAYLGENDPAAHAYAGRTPRNFVLFGPPAHAYVYFIYGNHYCLNVSCMPEGDGECVLFRALEPVFGAETMARARGIDLAQSPSISQWRMISSGPGRMSQAMGITRERDNNKDLASRQSDLWLADDGFRPSAIVATPRIGITKAVERPLRFSIAGSPYVSGKKIG
ncbi:MAG TPA: DNA-3-methyladenine glycosylase [Terriglobales bacterium]|nr:DNA-3-methyladenine glycosylase [Terriglobales bacterium]